ncbi:RNA polymerase sigma factor [Cytobacillus depressus]|nr:sigma factor [Cytobacillus depressus]
MLLKLCGSTQLAEDLTQEAFVRATVYLHTFEGEGLVLGYLKSLVMRI